MNNFLTNGHTSGTWAQNGTVVQGGQTFNVYNHSADASLQVLIAHVLYFK